MGRLVRSLADEVDRLRRGLERIKDQDEATSEEWGTARGILGGTHATDGRVIAVATLAHVDSLRGGE
jgi:hypothetical protein